MAAATAAELARARSRDGVSHEDLEIRIFEATDKIGRPILKSGNGRCNLTNAHVDASVYNDPGFVQSVFDAAADRCPTPRPEPVLSNILRHPRNPVATYFERHGVVLREETEGRIYPLANKSSVILDALRHALDRSGVHIELENPIARIDEPKAGKPLTLHAASGELFRADSVIVATGGTTSKGAVVPFAACTPLGPTLGPIATGGTFAKRLDNVRVRAAIALEDARGTIKAQERGEVMFRKYGVSGIAAFNLSRFMEEGDRLAIDFLPDIPASEMTSYLAERARMLASTDARRPTNFEMLRGIVLPAVADALLERIGLSADAPYETEGPNAHVLARALKSLVLECTGIGDASLCQVDRGGYATDQIDPATMALRAHSNIHITGEALDIDAPCGGFNLHWAFLTGMVAAASAVEGLIGHEGGR